jgi:hypothetical protein
LEKDYPNTFRNPRHFPSTPEVDTMLIKTSAFVNAPTLVVRHNVAAQRLRHSVAPQQIKSIVSSRKNRTRFPCANHIEL